MHTPPRRPAGRVLHSEKTRENLNPFVYQESAGRANSHNRYWNPGNATELPHLTSNQQYTRGSGKMPEALRSAGMGVCSASVPPAVAGACPELVEGASRPRMPGIAPRSKV